MRLTTAELLKNYVFKDQTIQSEYERLWKDVYEDSEELVNFWNAERTAGRIIRTNIEILLYCYLVIKTGSEVKLESLFKEYKRWLDGKDGEERFAFLRELREYAAIYSSFPSGPEINEIVFDEAEKRFFHLVENLTITTIMPLVLYIYKCVTRQNERREMLALLESYLVRRIVCRLTSKNYNLLFVQIINRLRESPGSYERNLARIMGDYKEDTNRFPRDDEFVLAVLSERLSNKNAREILFLLALQQVSDDRSDIRKLSLGNYTVEHIMPVKWEQNWLDRELTPEERASRARKLRTLGNLTLVTSRLNATMQNAAWESKKAYLRRFSTLPLTTQYLDQPLWNEETIERRSADLAETARRAWKGPG